MALVSDTDLASFGDLAEELLLKDSCEILRAGTASTDPGGGGTSSEQVVDTSPCALLDTGLSPGEQLSAEQLESRVIKQVMLPRLRDVRKSDTLRIGGVRYHVIAVSDPTTYEVLRRVSVYREE
jgi:hypothetical protein